MIFVEIFLLQVVIFNVHRHKSVKTRNWMAHPTSESCILITSTLLNF